MQGFHLIQDLPKFIEVQRAKNSLKEKAGENLLVQSMNLYGMSLIGAISLGIINREVKLF